MNFDSFFDQMERSNLAINFDRSIKSSQHLLDNEALFQLPLISLIILLMAKDRRKPFVSEIGQMVGESLESSMPGFKGSAQHLGWSANLRIRTVKALTFLEQANLVEIQNRKGRLEITELGRKVIDKALGRDDDLSYNLAEISRAYRNIRVSKQLDMELEQ
jgi:hypothetical protein